MPTLPVGGALGFAVGFVIGIPALRIRGLYLALITLGLALAFPAIVKSDNFFGIDFAAYTGGTERPAQLQWLRQKLLDARTLEDADRANALTQRTANIHELVHPPTLVFVIVQELPTVPFAVVRYVDLEALPVKTQKPLSAAGSHVVHKPVLPTTGAGSAPEHTASHEPKETSAHSKEVWPFAIFWWIIEPLGLRLAEPALLLRRRLCPGGSRRFLAAGGRISGRVLGGRAAGDSRWDDPARIREHPLPPL